jgi:excisionase family DNA binding protein
MKLDGTYISVSHAARILGVDEATVRPWIHRGSLPAVRMPGGRYRILRDDLRLVFAPVRRERRPS